jgi:hypothetical protein
LIKPGNLVAELADKHDPVIVLGDLKKVGETLRRTGVSTRGYCYGPTEEYSSH